MPNPNLLLLLLGPEMISKLYFTTCKMMYDLRDSLYKFLQDQLSPDLSYEKVPRSNKDLRYPKDQQLKKKIIIIF